LRFYERVGVLKVEELELEVVKIEESESKLLCIDSTAVPGIHHPVHSPYEYNYKMTDVIKCNSQKTAEEDTTNVKFHLYVWYPIVIFT
jgi:hypothetical protein